MNNEDKSNVIAVLNSELVTVRENVKWHLIVIDSGLLLSIMRQRISTLSSVSLDHINPLS